MMCIVTEFNVPEATIAENGSLSRKTMIMFEVPQDFFGRASRDQCVFLIFSEN